MSLSATDCYIVHEIYNGENAQDQFEYELEQALEAQYKYIVIEPTRIGDETTDATQAVSRRRLEGSTE